MRACVGASQGAMATGPARRGNRHVVSGQCEADGVGYVVIAAAKPQLCDMRLRPCGFFHFVMTPPSLENSGRVRARVTIMNWIKKLFGIGQRAPAAQAEQPVSPTQREALARQQRALSADVIVRLFAKHLPSAVIETFDGGLERADDMVARVTFTHAGRVARVLLRSDGIWGTLVWLETRCLGIYGDFNLVQLDPDLDEFRASLAAQDADEMIAKPRLFLTRECYVEGPRLRNEVARIRMLTPDAQKRMIALTLQVKLLKLDQEVLGVVLGEPAEFIAMLEDPTKGVPNVLEMASELGFLATQFPALTQDVVELAEARTCCFCNASFIFAPSAPSSFASIAPSCTACGAPAATAVVMPPALQAVTPDDPIEAFDHDDPNYLADINKLIKARRRRANDLVALVQNAHTREELDRARIFVEYTLDGRAFRAKIMDEYIGIRTDAKGVQGDFLLLWSEEDTIGEKNADNFWHESERHIFFSKHCRVRSGHGTKEAARLGSLPQEARATLLALCERFESTAQLEDERLAINFSDRISGNGMNDIVPVSLALAKIADAFPRDFDPNDPIHFRLTSCSHCGWAFFVEAGQAGCSHCDAPIAS